jgi:hypothetical protein
VNATEGKQVMKSKREVFLEHINSSHRRNSPYHVEAPAELAWFSADEECKAGGWVVELDRGYAYVTTNANVPVGAEVHVFVVLPPFGELNRILKIGFNATVEKTESKIAQQHDRGLSLKIHNLVLTGDEGQEEFSQSADSAGMS